LTLVELCVLLAIAAVIAGIVITAVVNGKRRSRSICCNCNLKQVGLAFHTWSLDHTTRYPTALSTNSGGTMEYLASGQTFRHFQVMSNELSTPNILVCPEDTRIRAESFVQGFANSNLSYFAGIV